MPVGLREKLIQLGSSGEPFTVRPGNDCDLYLEQKIVDAEYYGVASKEKVKKQYAAKMWLVEQERTVKYREIIEEEKSSAGVLPGLTLRKEKSFFKGKVLFQKEKEVTFGFKKPADPTSFGKVYEYDFDVRKVRDQVKSQVEGEGWKFEQVILDYKPSAAASRSMFCTKCGSPVKADAKFCVNCGQKVA